MNYVIHRERLAAFMVDPSFYRLLPEFEELRETAATQHAEFMVRRNGCCRDISYMFPSLRAAVDKIEAKRADEEFLTRLQSFLTERLGKTVDHVVVFYRETSEGEARRIKLR